MATRYFFIILIIKEIANNKSTVDKIKKLKIKKIKKRKSVKIQMTNVNKWMENHKPASFNEARIRLELLTANYER